MANHKLSDALSNLGLYRFRELLSYKQECFGFLLTIVDRWFPSSKTCSVCPNIQDIPLGERVSLSKLRGSYGQGLEWVNQSLKLDKKCR